MTDQTHGATATQSIGEVWNTIVGSGPTSEKIKPTVYQQVGMDEILDSFKTYSSSPSLERLGVPPLNALEVEKVLTFKLEAGADGIFRPVSATLGPKQLNPTVIELKPVNPQEEEKASENMKACAEGCAEAVLTQCCGPLGSESGKSIFTRKSKRKPKVKSS